MLKLLTAVCLGTAAISQAMSNNGFPPSFIPQVQVPNNPSFENRYNNFQKNFRRFSPVVPQEVNPASLNRNIRKIPIWERQPIPQMNVANAVPINPSIYPYSNSEYPQNSPNQQQQSHCENTEILFKIWSIFFNLLDTGREAMNPGIEKVKLALKLIKEYVETAPRNPQNDEVAGKLLTLEEALFSNKNIVPESKHAFHTIDDNIDTNDTVLTSSHRLPEKVNDPNCKEELAKVIQTAQKSYIQLSQSPICKDSLADPETVLHPSDFPLNSSVNFTISRKQYERPNYNKMKNLNAKNNEALKFSLGLLMNQSDYNAHDVFELLQNFKPIQSTESPPVDAVELVVNNTKPFNPNQTELNSNLLASDYNASQTNYNHSQLSDNVAINDWTNYSKATKIDPLSPNEIELTYALKRPQPFVYQPYYFVKYRLPFNSFLQNLGKVTQLKPTDTSKSELYKSVIQSWNADDVSPDLAHYTKEQVNDLVVKEGNLVEALLIQSKDKNMQINLDTSENLEAQLSEYNFHKGKTLNGDGKHLIEAQATSYYSDHNEEIKRRNFESNIRPGLDTPLRFMGYPSMVQKGPLPAPLKSYSDHLLYKSGFGKPLPVPHLPSALIET